MKIPDQKFEKIYKITFVNRLALISIAAFLLLNYCESIDPFERNNPHDPMSDRYKPNAPFDVQLRIFEEEVLELTWKDKSIGDRFYVIERKINENSFTKFVEVPQETNSILDTARIVGQYTYRIFSIANNNNNSDSVLSNTIEVMLDTAISMIYIKQSPKAVALPNGLVVVLDRYQSEFYDHASGLWWPTTQFTLRTILVAFLLDNGKVFMVKLAKREFEPDGLIVELFNPLNETWRVISWIEPAWLNYRYTLLQDGSILITGTSFIDGSVNMVCKQYYPNIGTKNTFKMNVPRNRYAQTLLNDGRVLVSGGEKFKNTLGSCELFDPQTGKWKMAASLIISRFSHRSVLLDDGRVLVVGGSDSTYYHSTKTCEIYNVELDQWSRAAEITNVRIYNLLKLIDGRVIAVTSPQFGDPNLFIEIYDSDTDSWMITHSFSRSIMGEPKTAVVLHDGSVLLVGITSRNTIIYNPN